MANIPSLDMDTIRKEVKGGDGNQRPSRTLVTDALEEQWDEWEQKNTDGRCLTMIAMSGAQVWASLALGMTANLVLNRAKSNEDDDTSSQDDKIDVARIGDAGDLLIDNIKQAVIHMISESHEKAREKKLGQYRDSTT